MDKPRKRYKTTNNKKAYKNNNNNNNNTTTAATTTTTHNSSSNSNTNNKTHTQSNKTKRVELLNLKQNEALSICADSINKGVN